MPKNEKEFVAIFKQTDQPDEVYVEISKEIASSLANILNISVSVGIGCCAESVSHLQTSYAKALDALRHKFYTGYGSIIHINDVESTNEIKERLF